MNYKLDTCSSCQKINWITNKFHNLCRICNESRLSQKRNAKKLTSIISTSSNLPPKDSLPLESLKSTSNNGGTGLKRTPLKKGNKNAADNSKFYREAWDLTDTHFCRNCGLELKSYSASYIAHLHSRGSQPKMKYDLENIIYLCLSCHSCLDAGDAKKMKIYPEIKELKFRLLQKYYSK